MYGYKRAQKNPSDPMDVTLFHFMLLFSLFKTVSTISADNFFKSIKRFCTREMGRGSSGRFINLNMDY